MAVRILEGDCRDVLRGLPADSVQMAVTSPPYWGLRDYGIPPSIWDGDLGCEHEWGDHAVSRKGSTNGRGDLGSTLVSVNAPKTLAAGETNDQIGTAQYRTDRSAFCQRCGAWAGAFGLEPTYQLYVEHAVEVFREVRRVLRPDGVMFLNLGDSYCSGGRATWRSGASENKGQDVLNDMPRPAQPADLKPKDLIGIPWRVAFALQADGWWLRQDIIWSKPNPMPESVTDRCTKAHEYLFLMTKGERYHYDAEAIKEASITEDPRRPYTSEGAWQLDGRPAEQRHGGKPRTAGNKSHKYVEAYEASDTEEHRTKAGLMKVADVPWTFRNKRSVWTIATAPYPDAHFATFPPDLVEPCIKAGTSEKGVCPKCGAPWERVMGAAQRIRVREGSDTSGDAAIVSAKGGHGANSIFTTGEKTVSETIGWHPTCGCDAGDPIPATVLDCFFGAGTTALVADRLGRDCIGIELNPEYAAMARKRLIADAGMFAEVAAE